MSERDNGDIPRCHGGYRYPARVKDAALQAWAFQCSRDAACVVGRLAVLAADELWPCVPDKRTVQRWASEHDWAGEVAHMVRRIAPDVSAGLVTDLLSGAVEFAPYLRAVLRGDVAKPSGVRIIAGLRVIGMLGLPALAADLMRDAGAGSLGIAQNAAIPDSIPEDMGDWKAALGRGTADAE